MSNLKSYELDLNTSETKEDKEVENYIRIIDEIGRLMYKNKLTIDDSIIVTDCLLTALTAYKVQGYETLNQIEFK